MAGYVKGKVYQPGESYETGLDDCSECGTPRTIRFTFLRRSNDLTGVFTYPNPDLKSFEEWLGTITCPVHGEFSSKSWLGSTKTVEEKESLYRASLIGAEECDSPQVIGPK